MKQNTWLKITILLLILLLALLACSAAAADDLALQVTLDKASYKVGDTVSISYAITGTGTNSWSGTCYINAERTVGADELWTGEGREKRVLKKELTALSGTVTYRIGATDGTSLGIHFYVFCNSAYQDFDKSVAITDGTEPVGPVFTVQAAPSPAQAGETVSFIYSVSGGSETATNVYYNILFHNWGRSSNDYDWEVCPASGTITSDPAHESCVEFSLKAETRSGWAFTYEFTINVQENAVSAETRIPVDAGVWVGKNNVWTLYNSTGTEKLTSMEGISCLEIPAAVTSVDYKIFACTTKEFYIKCTPGSAGEAIALKYGLQYDNGVRRVIGKDIATVSEKVDWIVSNYITSGMSERKKARLLHDWLIYNADYDYSYSNSTAAGVLLEGTGVCNSYSLAYQQLLNKAGIENTLLVGTESMDHIWNLVKIDGQWYHVDVTWDDSYRGTTAKYFLVTDKKISSDHYWDSPVHADANQVGFVEWNGNIYYYGENGQRHTGWLSISDYKEANGYYIQNQPSVFYFDQEGRKQTGIVCADGKIYHLSSYGQMAKDCWVEEGVNHYYFGPDGAALTGWQTMKDRWSDEDAVYYFHEDGHAANQLTRIDGKLYMFVNYKQIRTHGWFMVSFGGEEYNRYYVNDDYTLAVGWTIIQEHGEEHRYYFDENAQTVEGWLVLDEITYYLKPYAYTNRTAQLERDGITQYYVFDSNGAVIGIYDSDRKATVEGGRYELTKSRKSAIFVGPENKDAKKLTVLDKVSICGTEYKVTAIDDSACKGMKNLTKATIGKYVTKIGNKAFRDCVKLASVKGMDSVTTIGDAAFRGCSALTKFTIAASVKSIGKDAFRDCGKLKTMTIKTKKLDANHVGKNAFKTGVKTTYNCPKKQLKAYKKLILKKGAHKKSKFK